MKNHFELVEETIEVTDKARKLGLTQLADELSKKRNGHSH